MAKTSKKKSVSYKKIIIGLISTLVLIKLGFFLFDVITGYKYIKTISLGSCYSRWLNTITYTCGKFNIDVSGVDANSFEQINSFNDLQGYGKDKKSVFAGSIKIEGADPSSFERLKSNDSSAEYFCGSARDKNSYYVINPEQAVKIPFNAIKNVSFIGKCYSTDNQDVFFREIKLQSADPQSFSLLEGNYAKDKDSVFYQDLLISHDVNNITFFPNDSTFALMKDRVNVYKSGEKLHSFQASTFKQIGFYYIDEDTVTTVNQEPLVNVVPSQFHLIGQSREFGTDGVHVYYAGKLLREADPKTFRTFGTTGYAVDNKNVYHYEEIMQGKDPNTFVVPQE